MSNPIILISMYFSFSSMNIQELPKEMIESILKYLDGKSLYECTKVSQRFREIGRNKCFWQNIKVLPELHHVTKDYHSVYYPIPIHFLQFVIENGCKFLDLKITSLSKIELIRPKLLC